LRLHLREELTGRLTEWLEAARIDVALLGLPCACGSASTVPVGRDEFMAALPRDQSSTSPGRGCPALC
jgi:DNA-binding transcriptional LysR family regulator